MWPSPKVDIGVKEIGASWAYSWRVDPEQAFSKMMLSPPVGVELVPLVTKGQHTDGNFASI